MQGTKHETNAGLATLTLALLVADAGCSSDPDLAMLDASTRAFDASQEPAVDGLDGASPPADAGLEGRDAEADANNGAASCGSDAVAFSLPTSTLWLVVERSKSMLAGPTPAWSLLENALLADGGLLEEHGADLALGALFHGGDPGAQSCSELTVVVPHTDNRAGFAGSFSPSPAASAEPLLPSAMAYLLERVPARTSFADSPQALVLVRHRSTDTVCTGDLAALQRPPETTGEQTALRLVREGTRELVKRGAGLFVLDFGQADATPNEADGLATLGNTGLSALRPTNAGELADMLEQIVRRTRSCTLQLARAVRPEAACMGSVLLGGAPLGCKAANGFSLLGDNVIQLAGEACEQLRGVSPPKLEVTFPCAAYK